MERSHNTRSGAGTPASPAQPEPELRPGSSGQAGQETGSAPAAVRRSSQTAALPKSIRDPCFMRLRASCNTAKIKADNAIVQVENMGSRMQDYMDSDTPANRLRGYANQLTQTMRKARTAVEDFENSSTELTSLASYLVILLEVTDPEEAAQANTIQLNVTTEFRPYSGRLDELYRERNHLFDFLLDSEASSQASSQQSSRNPSQERGRPRFNDYSHLRPQILNVDCSVKEFGKWKTGMKEWIEHAFGQNGSQSLIWVSLKSCIDENWLEVLGRDKRTSTYEVEEVF